MIRIFLVALILSPAFLWAQDAVKRDEHQMHGLHNDPKAYIGSLEDPKRDAYQKPHEVLTALNIKPGEIIADIGAGSGYFTFRLSHFVGDKGKIYAVDVSPDMILHINRRIRELKATNVVSILADPDDPLLPDRSVNRFFYLRLLAPYREPAEISGTDEEDVKAGRRNRHDRLSQKGISDRSAATNENRPRRSDQTDGEPTAFGSPRNTHFCRINIFWCSRPSNRAPSPRRTTTRANF